MEEHVITQWVLSSVKVVTTVGRVSFVIKVLTIIYAKNIFFSTFYFNFGLLYHCVSLPDNKIKKFKVSLQHVILLTNDCKREHLDQHVSFM